MQDISELTLYPDSILFIVYLMNKFIPQIEPWLSDRESRLVGNYLRSGNWLTEFRETERFEKAIAGLLGVNYAVATTSGTIALTLGVMALGIGKGDEVIVPDYTMIATPNAVLLAGAKPVFADIEAKTLCMDLNKLPITQNTKAIIYVSINGRSGDIVKLKKICKEKNIHLIEDACQSFTSKHGKGYLGTFGELGCFSLSPHKIITTGQGGFVVTNNKEIYENVKRLKDFGRLIGGVDKHETIGFNFKFNDVQALIGVAQMQNITERIKRKKTLYKLYQKELSGIEGVEFIKTDLEETTPWCADILVPANLRLQLVQHLKDNGIGSRAFYPSINSQLAYKGFTKEIFPVSADISQRGLWLPSALFLKKSEIQNICNKIKEFFRYV